MPRKKAKVKQPSQRSHHGCQRCRLHKIRCDEAKPSCGACTSRGYSDCTFLLVLKWEADYRHVGRAFGRAGVWSKAGRIPTQHPSSVQLVCRPDFGRIPHIHQSGFLNLSVSDFDDQREEGDEDQLVPLLAPSPRSTPGSGKTDPQSIEAALMPRYLNDPLLDNLHHVDPHLVSYYLHQVCPLTVPSANYAAGSPFSAVLFPFALSSSSMTLMHAVLGLAASHRARFDTSFNPIALKYSRTALRSLRISLASKTSMEIAVDPETLILMMVLCQTELIKDGDSNWVIHLRGARNVMSFRRRQQQLSPTESKVPTGQHKSPWEQVLVFAERFFAFCDVLGRTACGEEPIFGNDFWSMQEGQVDLWMGCSPHLVSIISTIAELSWKYHHGSPSFDEQQELEEQRGQLHSLLQQPDLGWIAIDTDDDGVLRRCVELKRLTADLYLHAALANTTPLASTIKQRVQKILRLVHVLLNMGVKSGLAWPLFMAACQLDSEEELEWSTPDDNCKDEIPSHARPFILYALGQLSESLFNVDRTRAVIEKVWKRRESARLATSARHSALAAGAFNDWARFVAPLCHNISLA
ncbi:fungal-specific transcription factor domain-containing protein [Dactylonectria estremocensis]|uniref:Fungal-specific transcription factor domain-containing protein n=1 Tax=Dactylonectria estremocensis TaxID=1079267 RepID=A0A9P9EMA5_9HYPO|nr:fungal-specific transcription factor domain-containing protein [Dactylonectria estremocensis]